MKRINITSYPESKELHPTFKVDGEAFTLKAYDKRTPGLFKVETEKDKMISLFSKCIVQQKTQIIVIVVHVKILNVNVLINVNAILNFHARAYKKPETIKIIKIP